MKWMKTLRAIQWGENMVYSLVWIVVFLIPIMNAQLMSETHIDFNKVVISWGKIAPYFIIFIVNNVLLAPKLLLRNRYWLYSVLLIAMLVVIFGSIDILDFRYWQSDDDLRNKASFTDLEWYWNVLLGVFMAGANSMIKLYYRALDTEQRMAVLERENIETQMQYLKYQINPHFLMNTLNNIHAMIDFDGETAKKSVMELSRMLRHVLYDSSENYTTLDKEVEFLDNYIQLMRIRYDDSVDIRLNVPEPSVCRRVSLPPLLLIVLVENAFKHGISYNRPSFIDIDLSVQGENLCCTVKNSRHPSYVAQNSGIGLNNITKRMDMLFNRNYTLKIDRSNDDVYTVKMIIPIKR